MSGNRRATPALDFRDMSLGISALASCGEPDNIPAFLWRHAKNREGTYVIHVDWPSPRDRLQTWDCVPGVRGWGGPKKHMKYVYDFMLYFPLLARMHTPG